MNLTKRLEAVETALAKQLGELNYKLVIRNDDETEGEARIRTGLADWPGPIVFLRAVCANL